MELIENTISCERKYDGKIISVDLVKIELPNGRQSYREVVRHKNAVGILARKADGKFVLVKQYRKAAGAAIVEVIAGGMEAGETPEESAVRETSEETGYDVKNMKFLTTIICTPGYCEERIHLFYAELAEGQHDQHLDFSENVQPVEYTEEELDKAILAGEVFDGKTLSAWALYKLTK